MITSPTGDGILSAGLNFVSGLMNIKAQKEANEQNAQLYRESLAAQLGENQNNRAWQYKMWQENNAYNTPFMQMARLRQAGINPYLTNGESVGSTPSQMPSAPSASALPGAPSMQPLPWGSLAGSLAPLLQAEQVDSGAQQARANAISSIVGSATEIYKSLGKDAGDAFLNKYLPLVAGGDFFGSDTHNLIQSQVRQMVARSRVDEIEARLQDQFGAQRYSDMHSMMEQQFSESVAMIQAKKRELEQTDRSQDQKDRELELYAKSVAGQYMVSVASAGHLNADSKTVNSLRPWLVSEAEYKSYSTGANAVEDLSIMEGKSWLRGARKNGLYKAGVVAKGAINEAGVGDAAKLLIDALGVASPVKAAVKRGVPYAADKPSVVPKPAWQQSSTF